MRTRDRDTRAMYDFPVGLASLTSGRPPERDLFKAVAQRPEEVTRSLRWATTASGSN